MYNNVKKETKVMKSFMKYACLFLVVLGINVNALAETVILPKGSTTVNKGDWFYAGAPGSYNNNNYNITVAAGKAYSVRMYNACEDINYDNPLGLQIKKNGGYVEMNIQSTSGVTVTIKYSSASAMTMSLDGASDVDCESGDNVTKNISTTEANATLRIAAGERVGYLHYVQIVAKNSGTITANGTPAPVVTPGLSATENPVNRNATVGANGNINIDFSFGGIRDMNGGYGSPRYLRATLQNEDDADRELCTLTVDDANWNYTNSTSGTFSINYSARKVGTYTATLHVYGYKEGSWDQQYTLDIPINITISGTKRTLTVASPENGTITAQAVGNSVINEGGNDANVMYTQKVTLTQTPSLAGPLYELDHWDVYKTGDESTKVTVVNNQFEMPNYNVTVDAVFRTQIVWGTYQTYCPKVVTFDANGKDAIVVASNWPDDQNVKKGSTATAPTKSPTVNGGTFTFSHWSETVDGDAFDFATPIMADITLYAIWTQQGTNLDIRANNGTEPEEYSTCFVAKNSTASICAHSFTAPTGYVYNGIWTAAEDGSKLYNADGSQVSSNVTGYISATNGWICTQGDLTVYAQWKGITYQVQYDGNGKTSGTMVNSTHTYGTAKNLTSNNYRKTGYTFVGWNTVADGSGTSYGDGESVLNLTSTQDDVVILYAQWSQDKYTVTYHDAEGTQTEDVAHGENPVGVIARACAEENRVFMGWIADAPLALTQTAPAYVDPTTVTITAAKDFYAVYASRNGGKAGEESELFTETFEAENTRWIYESGKANRVSGAAYSCAAYAGSCYAIIVSNVDGGMITSTAKYNDVSKIGAWVYMSGGYSYYRYAIQYSTDGSAWTTIGDVRKLAANQTYEYVEATMPNVQDAYIRIVTTTKSGATKYYFCIDDVTVYQKSRTFYYTDYATSCDMAASATMTFAGVTSVSPAATTATTKVAGIVGEEYVLPTGVNAGKTFRYWMNNGISYNAGETYILAHDVTMTAVWEPELVVNGDVHLTTGNGLQVYTTTEANNLIELASEHLDEAKSIKIQYYDAEDNEITTKSYSLFRLCYAPGYEQDKTAYNVADGQNIPLSDAEHATAYSRKFAISYTPTAAGVENIGKIKFTLMTAGNSEITSTTVTLHGRSLPEKFVVATKISGSWYALRSDLSISSDNSTPQKAVKINVDNETTPTKALYAPEYTRYQAVARNAPNSYRGAVRLQSCTNNGYLQATESDAANIWLPTTNNSKGMQDWYLSSTDFGAYNIDLYPTDVTNYGRALSVYGGAIGWYTTSAKDFYLLPVHDETGDMMDIIDWSASSVTLNMNGYGANHGAWGIDQYGSATKLVATNRAGDRTLVVPTGDLTQGGLVQINVYGDMATTPNLESSRYYKVPFIFTTNTTISSDAGYDNSSILYIKSGVTTVNVNLTVAKVVVCPGAELVIASGKTLTTTDLVLRGKVWSYEQPILTNNGTLNVTNSYYARITPTGGDAKKYYQFGLPYASSIEGVHLSNGATTGYGPSANWNIQSYNVEGRAANGIVDRNWVNVASDATLNANQGYIMASASSYYREYYFPIAVTSTGNGGTEVAVKPTTAQSAAVNNNWNFITSPSTSVVTVKIGDPSEAAKICELTEDNKTYWQHIPTALRPFFPVYYQAAEEGTLNFTYTANRIIAKAQDVKLSTQWIQLFLENEQGEKDETTVFVNEDKFAADYEMGYDVAKFKSESARPQVYTRMACGDLAFNALPDSIAETRIPVGVSTGSAKTLTFSLGTEDYLDRVEHVYLVDAFMGSTVDLLLSDYTWSVEDGVDGRFYLNIAMKKAPQTPTDIGEVSGGDGREIKKIILEDKLFIIVEGRVYDATGKIVK